jgi:hypothetical protein
MAWWLVHALRFIHLRLSYPLEQIIALGLPCPQSALGLIADITVCVCPVAVWAEHRQRLPA